MSAIVADTPEDDSTPIQVRRPPRSRLVSAPAPHSEPPDPTPPTPVTSPTKPWDRCELAATPYRSIWREETESLDDPLPEGAPHPERTAGAVIICALQVLLGHRPANILRNWLTPEVYAILARRAGLAIRLNGRAPKLPQPRIRRLRTGRPRTRAIEVSAVAHDGLRMRAVALRMEFLRDRWKVVALEIG